MDGGQAYADKPVLKRRGESSATVSNFVPASSYDAGRFAHGKAGRYGSSPFVITIRS